jgi:thymidine phosphorylase
MKGESMGEDLIERLCTSIQNNESMLISDLMIFIEGVAQRSFPIDDIEKWLRCVHSNGISVDETTALTRGMMDSGAVLEWQGTANVVDKHSTGGVGDKMSLILAPALAACGLRVPMLAGRGLGHTGGTIDKLEAIPGFNCNLTPLQMQAAVEQVGCCIAAQNDAIAPADGLLYAIRDVTNTVDSIPLITASIVSKKAAEGLNALVLDVKCGNAAFMKTEQEAVALAESMVGAAKGLGIDTVAQITDMNEPIGTHIGNSLEVLGSVYVLRGKGSTDTRDLVALQGGQLLALTGISSSLESGIKMILEVLGNGKALHCFIEMCVQQGTEREVAEQLALNPEHVLPKSEHITVLLAPETGYIQSIDAMALAEVARELGAGRFVMSDHINHSIGYVLESSRNQHLKKGQPWISVHHDHELSSQHLSRLRDALQIASEQPAEFQRLIRIIT